MGDSTSTTAAGRRARAHAGDVLKEGPRRGRPPKFGRPSQVVALTLPEDILEKLRRIHVDPGWAIVQLVEQAHQQSTGVKHREPEPIPPVALAQLPGRRALILTRPDVFDGLPGISTIPLADGRAFLAFDAPAGIADLEVSIIDRLDDTPMEHQARPVLEQVRDIVRSWRRHPELQFKSKAIIIVEGGLESAAKPLAALRSRTATASRPRSAARRTR